MYAWESADSGAEATPEQVIGPDRAVIEILNGRQEQHISADVAYAVWQYWQATADETFLRTAGAEILFETARFWASRATLEADGKRHIRGVIGPDEYHESIDDNAFTNVMARWNILRALDTVTFLRKSFAGDWSEISGRLSIDDAELALWSDCAATLVAGQDPKSGLVEQFAGYFQLEDIDLRPFAKRSVPMDVVLGRDRVQQSQILKQADVVALLALLPGEFTPADRARNFDYYESRCSHGSSLSRIMHAVVAARLGKTEMALRFFEEAAAIDLSDTRVAIVGGIHIATQGGIWLAAVMGFAGVSLREDGLSFDPKMPPHWHDAEFRLQWRGRRLHVAIEVAARRITLTLEAGATMCVYVGAAVRDLTTDTPVTESFRERMDTSTITVRP